MGPSEEEEEESSSHSHSSPSSPSFSSRVRPPGAHTGGDWLVRSCVVEASLTLLLRSCSRSLAS